MNQFSANFTRGIQKQVLEKFQTESILSSLSWEREFKERVKIHLPWYLRPFRKTIEDIALSAFCTAKFNASKGDTVKIKRPCDYPTQSSTN